MIKKVYSPYKTNLKELILCKQKREKNGINIRYPSKYKEINTRNNVIYFFLPHLYWHSKMCHVLKRVIFVVSFDKVAEARRIPEQNPEFSKQAVWQRSLDPLKTGTEKKGEGSWFWVLINPVISLKTPMWVIV